ncbi:NHL repeat containing 3 [Phyllostomus discolor]|uniref:NHL repeat containing 3 n=1 Tax=Phyllostomus discolor TaxID=89673 RepID=A0A834DKN4_9CHIR|nr:NHL repeat containing 3 [Phyllostomus discolor]
MARVWLCAGGAGCLLAFLVLHSHLSGSPVLRDFVFQISWRTEDVLYRLDVGWPKHPEYFAGATFCVAVDSPNGLVYVAQRGDDVQKVLVFTEDGYFLRAWNHTVDTPHGMFAASTPQEPAVWITDVGSGPFGHTVKKYDSFGDLVQVLGTPGQSGAGLNPLQFDSPSELYVEDSGDIYVVDGDGGLNNRLIKLSQDLTVLWLRGERGTGPGEFHVPHSVTVDSLGRVWVADRGNKRVQAFERDTGAWLGAWDDCFAEEGPSSVRQAPPARSRASFPCCVGGGGSPEGRLGVQDAPRQCGSGGGAGDKGCGGCLRFPMLEVGGSSVRGRVGAAPSLETPLEAQLGGFPARDESEALSHRSRTRPDTAAPAAPCAPAALLFLPVTSASPWLWLPPRIS